MYLPVFTIYCSIYTFYTRALKSFPLIMVLSKMLVMVMKHALQYVNELQPPGVEVLDN